MPNPPDDRTDGPRGGTRVPPHDIDAERSLLGAWIHSRSTDIAPVDPADFYRPAHAAIATAIQRVSARGDAVDPITVAAQLVTDGHPPGPTEHGEPHWASAAGLTDLQADGTAPSVAPSVARVITGHARHRRIIDAAQRHLADAWDTDDPAQVLLDHRHRLDELGATLTAGSHLRWADIAAVVDGGAKPTEPDLLARTDGKRLFYSGLVHTLQAAPSTGKSWVSLLIAAEALVMGGAAVYLDWEDSAESIVGRLIALGLDPATLAASFRYARVEGPWTAAEAASVHQVLDDVNPEVVIIDGVAQAIAYDGGDENVASDCLAWNGRVIHPIAATGAAVVMLDHTAKASEKGDRYSRGSGSKLGMIDGAAYNVVVLDPYSRTKAGKMALVCAKDRPGNFAIGETVAHIAVEPSADGEVVRMGIEPPPEPEDGRRRPTTLMARISELLERGPLAPDAVFGALGRSKKRTVQWALRELMIAENIELQHGPGGTPVYILRAPFTDPAAKSGAGGGGAPRQPHLALVDAEPPSDFVDEPPPDHDFDPDDPRSGAGF